MRYAAVATLTALVVIGLVLFAIEIRTILLWVLIGIVLAIGLQPAVAWLMRRGWGHTVAGAHRLVRDDRRGRRRHGRPRRSRS